jgi:squalene-hopene/tetraprenyl-beta-curcumene cyclase
MRDRLEERCEELSGKLIGEMNDSGFWTGRLSSSALGVAVAVAALHFYDRDENQKEIRRGLQWLVQNINPDGSFGDTPESPGNISTSLLVYAAVNLYSSSSTELKDLLAGISGYLKSKSIDVSSPGVSKAILDHYEKDYTFSVPILSMCALCGLPGENAFKSIPQLPFELALLPRKFYRLLNLSVVSYAIPALVAVGLVIHKNKKANLLLRLIRKISERKTLNVLEKMLPESGGFLEAIPLTGFVSLSLINAGYADLEVVRKGIRFLKSSQREDGSWPIDVDLSTWVTSLSVKALRSNVKKRLTPAQIQQLINHYKSIQNKTTHPFNGTGPGGWGWTSYSGSVPDGDDTPGAILALLLLTPGNEIKREILSGGKWLVELQNKDGGFPTFSRGWGKLPFDQSCADLTGHTLLALCTSIQYFENDMKPSDRTEISSAIQKAIGYLRREQKSDGAWLPLWFGNQLTSGQLNPVYGTARVLTYLQDVSIPTYSDALQEMIGRGRRFLLAVQNGDGSWGGDQNIPGTIEETSLAISALLPAKELDACDKGFKWLDSYYAKNGMKPAPIGLYFASLWYSEKLYPLTAYLEAITRYLGMSER